MEIRPIAHIRTGFPTKFGVPRQSGLVSGLEAVIVMEPEYRVGEAFRGLEAFSHLWLGKGIPVLSHEELAALLMGYDPWEIGLQIHQVQVESLLDKIGIEYDPKGKYADASGRQLAPPEKPTCLCV